MELRFNRETSDGHVEVVVATRDIDTHSRVSRDDFAQHVFRQRIEYAIDELLKWAGRHGDAEAGCAGLLRPGVDADPSAVVRRRGQPEAAGD